MTPRPIIRWKSFWFGFLMLGFLLFAWAVSMDSLRGAGVRTASGWLVFAQFQGEVCLAAPPYISPWGGTSATTVILYAHGTGGSPEYMVWWEGFTPYGLSFPHWLLMLFVLLPWCAFLAWRVRKQRTLTKSPV
jgi:hypothetical protein